MPKRPRFSVCKIFSGWEWNLAASNGTIVATSVDAYKTKSHAKRACNAARRNAKLAYETITEEC